MKKPAKISLENATHKMEYHLTKKEFDLLIRALSSYTDEENGDRENMAWELCETLNQMWVELSFKPLND